MKAMVLTRFCDVRTEPEPLQCRDVPEPVPSSGEVLLKVSACGICHTELDEIEGRTPPPRLPVIPGHQVVGRVESLGDDVSGLTVGQRVGVAWIHSACGTCGFCDSGRENLCASFRATGRDVDGGYAQFMVAQAAFVFPIPGTFPDIAAAPLLCAGAIGYRSLMLADLRNGQRLGLTGFGGSGHLVLKLVRHHYPDTEVFVFARSGAQRTFARELGAAWAGDTEDPPPASLDCIIDTTPAWRPVVAALAALAPGGRLVVNAIRKEDGDKEALRTLEYEKHLWMEKQVVSVANVTRHDVTEFLRLAAAVPIRPEVREYGLKEANRALVELRTRKIRGAKVLRVA